MDFKIFICFTLVKDRYRLVSEGDVLISKKDGKGGGIAFCAAWIACEGTFIDTKSHTGP